jgi:DNA polymerase-3 subunit epsilon
MGLVAWWQEQWGLGSKGADLPLAELRFTVLDTELTGLDERRDDIVAIGALHMQGGRIELGHSFQELVKPSAVLDGRTVIIHGITPEQLEARPAIGTVLSAFQTYVAGTVLLGHCLAIDLAYLNRDARRLKQPALRNPAVDTLALYGWLRHRGAEHPAFSLETAQLSLFDLATAFDIHVEEAHSAIGDAYVTAQVFQRLLPFLAEAGVETLASLRRVGDPRNATASLSAKPGHTHF